MTLYQLLQEGVRQLTEAGVETPDRTAHWLWRHVSTMTSTQELLALREEVAPSLLQDFLAVTQRRCEREPLQYILAEAEFCGMTLYVDKRVLIPRPETEQLVQRAVMYARERLRLGDSNLQICDVGTGSGAVAVAVAQQLLRDGLDCGWQLTASDISPAALEVASCNAKRHGVSPWIQFCESDLLLGRAADQPIDLLLANLPYIPSGDSRGMQPEVVRYEPAQALFSGADGLVAYRRLAEQARARLAPAGLALWEIGIGQSRDVQSLMRSIWPDAEVGALQDAQGIERIIYAKRPTR